MPSDPLETLRRQYFALVPPYLLHIPPSALLALDSSQQYLLDNLITTPHPPESSYRRKFWRKLLPAIEAGLPDGDEDAVLNETLSEEVYSLMAQPGPASTDFPPPSYKTFIYDDNNQTRSITLLEDQVAIQAGTTGLRTWTAALHLAHHVLHGIVPLGPAIELGAGTGFLSILWAQMGGEVIATDLDGGTGGVRSPFERMAGNIAMNDVGGRCTAMPLDWAEAEKWDPRLGQGRVILAADVIYDPEIVPLLVGAISTLLRGGGKCAVLAATVRNEDTFRLFLDTCGEQGMSAELLQLEPMDVENPTFWDTALDRGTRVEIVRVTLGNA